MGQGLLTISTMDKEFLAVWGTLVAYLLLSLKASLSSKLLLMKMFVSPSLFSPPTCPLQQGSVP
jgi:hypothetical protein